MIVGLGSVTTENYAINLVPGGYYISMMSRPVARGGSGGSEEPPSWKKGPQFQ